jgi:hypothetical protein
MRNITIMIRAKHIMLQFQIDQLANADMDDDDDTDYEEFFLDIITPEDALSALDQLEEEVEELH